MMKAAALVIALLFGVSQGLTLSFSANNVSHSGSHDFSFRSVNMFALANTVGYSSVAIDHSGEGDSNGGSGSASIDVVAGMAYVSLYVLGVKTISAPPTSWMGYFSADANYDYTNIKYSGSVDAAGGFAATVFTKIDEVNAAGEVVNTQVLSNVDFGGAVYTSAEGGRLHYSTFTYSGAYEIKLVFAVSAVLGKIATGDATITPKSLETFLEINGYPYAAPENHLRLTVYTANLAASATKAFTATNTLIAGSGEAQVYFKFSGEAICDGENKQVTVSAIAEGGVSLDDLENAILKTQIEGNSQLSADVRRAQIDFPAGAAAITYDPTMGFGAPDSAAFLAPSLSLLLLSLFALFALF